MEKLSVEGNEHGQRKKFLLDLLKKEPHLKRINSILIHEVTVASLMVGSVLVWTEFVLG
jgi:hypothetical protein